MATSEPRLTVKESLTSSELDDVDALVREARWNQLAADWRIFIEFGRLYAIPSADGRIIATTATLPYGGRFAWISMVLVAGEYRRRGLGTMMLRRAMADLAAAQLLPRPPAPAPPRGGGRAYRKPVLEASWGFQRLTRRERQRAAASGGAPAGVPVRPITDADWPALCAYDAAAFGAARSAVLAGLRGRLPA